MRPAAATALATRSCSSFIARARSSVPPLAGSAPILAEIKSLKADVAELRKALAGKT